MTETPDLEADKQKMEEVLRCALRSVLGSTGPGVNPKTEFYNKFQREMEEHDRDFEKRYDEDLNTTLIFSGLFSAVTSAFIIDVQSELKPDYEEMNNRLLEMLLNVTTGTLPAGSVTPIPRWSGPDPTIVQVQCIFYATLCATLLASLLAMLGKQWLNRYRQTETRGSIADRSRVRERKLSGVETWRFHLVMESLPLILQCALVLLGFALSRYLWGVSRPASSVVIGFTGFGFLFYTLITTASIISFNCPFQTPFSLLVRFVIGLAAPHWRNLRQTLGPKRRPSQPGTLRARHDLPLSMNVVGRGPEFEASITALACIAPGAVQFPWSVTPLFVQVTGDHGDSLGARCVNRMFAMSTDVDVVTSIMDFIPEIIWHSGIKTLPLRRIYDTLMDCFDFSGASPVVIPRSRDLAYLSAKAFVHIELQRRCIAQYKEHKWDGWKALCADHRLLSLTDHDPDPDLKTVLFMVDMTLGYDGVFPLGETQMTEPHRAWVSHVLLHHAWKEGEVLEVVMDFVEDSMSLELPSDTVITDCLFIIGLMVGVPIHVNDVIVRDKSREKNPALGRVFGALSVALSSKYIQAPSALHALRLVTRLVAPDVALASYGLFKTIMGCDNLTDQHWEAARLAIHGAFQVSGGITQEMVGELKEILKFLNHHLALQGAGEDHEASITQALVGIQVGSDGNPADPPTAEYIRNWTHSSPLFMKGICSIMHPDGSFQLRAAATHLIVLTHDQWFNSPVPVMEPEEMSKFCEHLTVFIIDDSTHLGFIQRWGPNLLFWMLHSPEWRKHIVTRFWRMAVYSIQTHEEDEEPEESMQESLGQCLQKSIELLEFTRGLADGGEGLKWWYGVLWFFYHKLDATVQEEVEKIAREMSLGDGLLHLNLYLGLIGQEVARIRQDVDKLPYEERLNGPGMRLRAMLIALEGNYNRLARITGER